MVVRIPLPLSSMAGSTTQPTSLSHQGVALEVVLRFREWTFPRGTGITVGDSIGKRSPVKSYIVRFSKPAGGMRCTSRYGRRALVSVQNNDSLPKGQDAVLEIRK